jgi:LmbE family N-acetylglucosaminyl deacetylase
MNKGTEGGKIIIFIFAHPDDEAYGPAGTIAKLARDNRVIVVSLCRGDRPGTTEVESARKDAFMACNNSMGSTAIIMDNSDTELEYKKAVREVGHIIDNYKPEVVYTHNISDLHKDHRLVAEACLVACRPKPESSVKELYMSESPVSTDWAFGKIGPVFEANTFVDVEEYMEIKRGAVGLYTTEIYDWPDARSIESVEVLAKYRGKQIGVRFAEGFSQVFRQY